MQRARQQAGWDPVVQRSQRRGRRQRPAVARCPTTTLGAAWHSPGSRRPASRVLLNVCQLPRHICWPKLTGATTPCGTAGTSVFLGGKQ